MEESNFLKTVSSGKQFLIWSISGSVNLQSSEEGFWRIPWLLGGLSFSGSLAGEDRVPIFAMDAESRESRENKKLRKEEREYLEDLRNMVYNDQDQV